jgi:hypothetical protein
MLKKNLMVIAILVLGIIFTSDAFGQRRTKHSNQRLGNRPALNAVTVLDNEAKLTFRSSKKRKRDAVFIGGGASTGARHSRKHVRRHKTH